MKNILFFTCIFFSLMLSSGQAHTFDKANELYGLGEYEQARDIYTELIENKGYSASLCYNLANSYAMLQENGMAILYYERALRLAPGDPDISQNLKHVQEEARIYTKPSMASQFINSGKIRFWSLGALFFFSLITIFLFVLRRRIGKKKTLSYLAIGFSSLGFILSTSCTYLSYTHWSGSIVTTSTHLLLSPFNKAEKIGTLGEGKKIFTTKEHGKFYFVVTSTGAKGWVDKGSITPILPK